MILSNGVKITTNKTAAGYVVEIPDRTMPLYYPSMESRFRRLVELQRVDSCHNQETFEEAIADMNTAVDKLIKAFSQKG